MQNHSEFLKTFEKSRALTVAQAARLLGIAYPTYAAYRACSRALPEYHVDKVILLENLTTEQFEQFRTWKLNGNRTSS